MKNKYIVFVGIGFELVGIMVACLYVGKALDEHYGLQGLGMAGISMAGLAGWIVHIVMLTKAMDRSGDDKKLNS